MPKYIGVSIGPIVRTIQSAKKIREIWAASYVFSYIMKQIITEFKDRKEDILLPYIDDDIFNQKRVGIFPDRFIFKSQNDDFETLKYLSEKIVVDLAKKYDERLTDTFRKYFQIYFIEKEFNTEKKSEVITQISSFLDAIDHRQQFLRDAKESITSLLAPANTKSFLRKEGGYKDRFPCILEIAAKDLANDFSNFKEKFEDDLEDEDILKIIEGEDGKKVRKAHKYIAIVYYDGDNFGKTLNNLDDTKKFSQSIYEFSKKAVEKVTDYGGLMIYASGDDGFFFAPVVINDKNIFDLLQDIKEVFEENIKKEYSETSISFGLSISYYKYPMNEAVSESMNLLFGKAKYFDNKNAVAFKILKHSGHYFDGVYNQASHEYAKFLEILKSSDENFLSSLIFKTNTLRGLLSSIGADKEKIDSVFDNFFNEGVHISSKSQIDKIKEFYKAIMTSDKYNNFEDKINLFVSSLRFNKFLGEK